MKPAYSCIETSQQGVDTTAEDNEFHVPTTFLEGGFINIQIKPINC